MRFVIFGAGAIGGVAGARLHQAGHDVVLIARGAHLDAIQRDGLTLVTPVEQVTLPIRVAGAAAEIDWADGDVVLLATKSQDTIDALTALRDAAGPEIPVVCLQNGVENERVASRLMRHVYGAVVMSPTAHLEPGVVEASGARLSGMIDVGRYPSGTDELCEDVCEALASAQFLSNPAPDVMRLKHAKLLLNLTNAVNALCRPGPERDELAARAQEEGRAALTAAGIDFVADEVTDLEGRWARLDVREIAGRPRSGSSTWQSLARGTGALETDFLNGEIVLQGRLHDVPTPVNAGLCRLADRAARARTQPGAFSADDVLEAVPA